MVVIVFHFFLVSHGQMGVKEKVVLLSRNLVQKMILLSQLHFHPIIAISTSIQYISILEWKFLVLLLRIIEKEERMVIFIKLKKHQLFSPIFSQVKINDGFLMNGYLEFPVRISFFTRSCLDNWIAFSQKEEKLIQGLMNSSFLFWQLSHLSFSDILHYLKFQQKTTK